MDSDLKGSVCKVLFEVFSTTFSHVGGGADMT